MRRKETIEMRGNYVAMKQWDPPRESMIELPDGYTSDLPRGEVVAVGPLVEGIKVGDVVFVSGLAGASPMEINDERLIVVHERDVTGIVKFSAILTPGSNN